MNDVPFADQLKVLFEKLTQELGYKIILGLQAHDKPKDEEGETQYPYVGYNILTSRRVANIKYSENDGDDVHQWWEEQYEFTLSFVAVDTNPFGSVEVAKSLFSWLTDTGQDWMMAKQIVHVSSTPISNRDFFLINDYERRNGFDCRLRLGRKVEVTIPRIEEVNVRPGPILN